MLRLIVQSFHDQPLLTLGACGVVVLVFVSLVLISAAERVRFDDEETDGLPQEGDLEAGKPTDPKSQRDRFQDYGSLVAQSTKARWN